jgi:endonuclease YncB( thermonuclease family)
VTDLYAYRVLEATVVDAGTVDIRLSLGFRVDLTDRFRLYGPDPDGPMGLNAPELNTPAGRAARDWLRAYLTAVEVRGGGLVARTVRDRKEKYGRYLAVLLVVGPGGGRVANVNEELVLAGHAVLKAY